MEVADRLAIINQGRLEQVGTPAAMYDRPANEFVLTFLGPATRLRGEWVRPHDLAIHDAQAAPAPEGAVEGTVSRVTHLGFEVKVDVALADGDDCWVQLSRGTAADLHLEPGQRVWVVPSPSAQPVMGCVGVEPSAFKMSNPSGVLSSPGAVPATSGTP